MANYTGRKVLLKDEDDNAIIPYIDGIIDSNTSNTIKTWTGTKAQYDALSSKDSNTLYNITDDESNIVNTINDLINTTKNMLSSAFPVGSVYLSTTSTCPLASLISGSTWQQLGTSIITSVNTSVPVKGNGKSIQFYNGTNRAELSTYFGSGQGWGQTANPSVRNVGTTGLGTSNYFPGTGNTTVSGVGLTTNADYSGIVGTVTRTSISVYIFKRTA